MAVSMVRGLRTSDLVSSSLIKRDVFEAIYNFKPYQTPLTQFFLGNRLAKRQVGNFKFELQEDVLVPYTTTLASAVSGGGTTDTYNVASGTGAYFKVGDIVRSTSTNENARVTSISTDALSVSKVTSGNITAIASGATLLVVGSAYAEGSTAAQFLSTVSTFPYNYAQILKKSVHLSGTQAATVNFGGDDWVNQRMKSTEEFKLDIERMTVYGLRNIDTTSGANIFYSSGLLDSSGIGISDSSQYVGTDFCTEDYFFKTFCKALFAKGSKEKVMYCGPDTILGINSFSQVKQKTNVPDTEYGVDITDILTPFGKLKLVWHPLLEGDYSNWGIAVDRDDYLKYAFLSNGTNNRDMQWINDISTPGTDERKAMYLAQIGLHLAGGGQGYHRVLKSGASA